MRKGNAATRACGNNGARLAAGVGCWYPQWTRGRRIDRLREPARFHGDRPHGQSRLATLRQGGGLADSRERTVLENATGRAAGSLREDRADTVQECPTGGDHVCLL